MAKEEVQLHGEARQLAALKAELEQIDVDEWFYAADRVGEYKRRSPSSTRPLTIMEYAGPDAPAAHFWIFWREDCASVTQIMASSAGQSTADPIVYERMVSLFLTDLLPRTTAGAGLRVVRP